MEITDILNCIASLVGLLVSIIAIIISINTTRKQTKMDLFNKRYEFYIVCDIICACCLTDFNNIMTKHLELYAPHFNSYTIGTANYLFDKETANLILEIYSKGMNYRDINYSVKCFESGENNDEELYRQLKKIKDENIVFFENARKDLDSKFKKYLDLM